MKNIFITGATGFIGQHLINDLSEGPFLIYALSRTEIRSKNENIKYLKGDISDISKFHDIFKRIDVFVNIAGEKSCEANMKIVNVNGVTTILNELSKYPNIKFLQVSSAGVYGIERNPSTILTEESDVFPNNTYEKTKYEAELLITEQCFRNNQKYTIIRPTNVIGENDKGLKLLNLFKAIKNNKFFLMNPNAIVNYVYVGQVTYIIRMIIENDLFIGNTYNVNSSCPISEFISTIKKTLYITKKTNKIPKKLFFALKIVGLILDHLPRKFQFFTSGKYRELTSVKFYSTNELNKIIHIDEKKMLSIGISKLVYHYKEKGLL